MTDIADLIVADHRRILDLQEALGQMTRGGAHCPSSRPLERAWNRVTMGLELHLEAEDEVCWLPGLGNGPAALAVLAEVVDDHAELRETVAEAALLPTGSALWWRSVGATRACCLEHFHWEERTVLAALERRTARPLPWRLAVQWATFRAARLRDLDPAGLPEVTADLYTR